MGSLENRLRRKWQTYGGRQAIGAEHSFEEVFANLFDGTELQLISQPKIFDKLYLNVRLTPEEMSQIYVPDKNISHHGIRPDFLICNTLTGKSIFVEIKRQDGWVEGKSRSAGRGNAHERLCKYFTPGLLKALRAASGIPSPYLPFWIVFQGDITRDICRVREIRFWFDGNNTNVTFWRDVSSQIPIIEHFLNNILPLLQG